MHPIDDDPAVLRAEREERTCRDWLSFERVCLEELESDGRRAARLAALAAAERACRAATAAVLTARAEARSARRAA